MKKSIFWSYALIWVAVAVAVIAGMLITKSASCLWAFLLPCFIAPSVTYKDDDDEEEDEKEDKEKDE